MGHMTLFFFGGNQPMFCLFREVLAHFYCSLTFSSVIRCIWNTLCTNIAEENCRDAIELDLCIFYAVYCNRKYGITLQQKPTLQWSWQWRECPGEFFMIIQILIWQWSSVAGATLHFLYFSLFRTRFFWVDALIATLCIFYQHLIYCHCMHPDCRNWKANWTRNEGWKTYPETSPTRYI